MSLAETFQLSKSAIFSKGREQVCADLIHENESQIAPPPEAGSLLLNILTTWWCCRMSKCQVRLAA